jgi:hypothetical protein
VECNVYSLVMKICTDERVYVSCSECTRVYRLRIDASGEDQGYKFMVGRLPHKLGRILTGSIR